jgi:hypothetical protein
MAEEEKDKPVEQESKEGFEHISRRSFLKDAGFVVGVPAIGSIAITVEADASQAKRGVPAATEIAQATTIKQVEGINSIELPVNGGKYKLAVEPHWTLRQILRDQIGFTSPKYWCGGLGTWGSCTESRRSHQGEIHR